MRWISVCIVAIVFMSIAPLSSSTSEAAAVGDTFSISLTDSEGNDLSDPLFGDVKISFNTFDSKYGTVYKINAMLEVGSVPANVLITAPAGLFTLSVKAEGLGSFVAKTGMRLTVSSGEDSFTADITKDNNFSTDFRNGGNIAALEPNIPYSLSVHLLDAYESNVPPSGVSNIRITFQAMASEGYHQVIFVDGDNVIESFLAFDGYVIEKVPIPHRAGYTFKEWVSAGDGKVISDGYVISPSDGDIYAVAVWEKNDNGNIIILAIGGGSVAACALLLLFLLKRRRSEK